MKKAIWLISSFLCVVLLFVSVPVTTSAALPEEKSKDEVNLDEYNHSLSYLTKWSDYSIDELNHEEIGGVDYIYTVENGEAALLNIHLQHKGPDKIVITLPTSLGGYPVTTIGDIQTSVEVFWFIQYDEDIDWEEETCVEYDPGLDYVSKIIIPEGYEYIGSSALHTFSLFEWQFPKSLKMIYGMPFEYMYTSYIDYKNNSLFLPECDYDNFQSVYSVLSVNSYSSIVSPSRYKDAIFDLTAWNYGYMGYSGDLYIPSNITASEFEKEQTFFYFEAAYGTWGAMFPTYVNATIHCAPDCEWLSLFDKYTYESGFTYWDQVVLDVVPATHIAFDSEDVSVAVGEVVDLEAKTYPAEAVWTACDYVSSNPEVVKVDPYSGRITALAEGTATITATHVERGFVDSCTVTVEPYVEHECEYSTEWATDENYHWHECADSDCQEISNYAEHSGGTATVNAKAVCEYCGMAYGEYAQASYSVEPVSDIAYCAYGNREYKVTVAGSPDKIQFIRYTGTTSTYVRSQAEIIDNGDGTETWIVTARLNKGAYTLATKYGRVWNKNGAEFEIVFDTPSCRSFTSEKTGNITTFTVVTDPQVTKIQFITQSGGTLTYSQGSSYIGEDGLRYWIVSRKITKPGTIGLRTKYGSIWTTTDFTVEV